MILRQLSKVSLMLEPVSGCISGIGDPITGSSINETFDSCLNIILALLTPGCVATHHLLVSLGEAECRARLIVPFIDTGGEAGVADGCAVHPHKRITDTPNSFGGTAVWWSRLGHCSARL